MTYLSEDSLMSDLQVKTLELDSSLKNLGYSFTPEEVRAAVDEVNSRDGWPELQEKVSALARQISKTITSDLMPGADLE